LSFEEAGELPALLPWKSLEPRDVYGERSLLKGLPLQDVLLLSTCNRVEIIYCLEKKANHAEAAHGIMSALPVLGKGVRPRFLTGREALRHLIRLAAGLESLVLGETEIKAQMKQAFEEAAGWGMLDKRLRTVFQHVFEEARHIRSSISMNNLPLSLATLAVKRLRSFDVLTGQANEGGESPAAVIIGSGPMSRQSAEYLSKSAPRIVLVNRSLSKIAETADRLGAQAIRFNDFLEKPEIAGPVAAVITATSRPDAFIDRNFVERLRGISGAPERLALVDLALPEDVDASCAEMKDVNLVNLETLRAELEENNQKRKDAARGAEELLERALVRIEARLIAALSSPLIKELQKEVRDVSREKLESLLNNRLAHMNQRDRRLLYSWAIQANRDLNRIHRKGLEAVLSRYYEDNPAPSLGEY